MIWLSGSSHCESTRKEVYPCLDRPVHHPLVDGSDKYERDKVSFVRARNVSCECGAKTCDSLPRQCGCWYSAEQGRVEFDSGKKGFAQKEAYLDLAVRTQRSGKNAKGVLCPDWDLLIRSIQPHRIFSQLNVGLLKNGYMLPTGERDDLQVIIASSQVLPK